MESAALFSSSRRSTLGFLALDDAGVATLLFLLVVAFCLEEITVLVELDQFLCNSRSLAK